MKQKDTIKQIRGSQKVTDQNPEGKYEALENMGVTSRKLPVRVARPVIGRDDEIRRTIQILSRHQK